MTLDFPPENNDCPIEQTLQILSGRWTVLIILALRSGPQRFSHLQRLLPDINSRVLSRRLRELEEARLLKRQVYPQVPPRVDYSLTPLGQSLEPLLEQMNRWGIAYKTQRSA